MKKHPVCVHVLHSGECIGYGIKSLRKTIRQNARMKERLLY